MIKLHKVCVVLILTTLAVLAVRTALENYCTCGLAKAIMPSCGGVPDGSRL